VSSPTADRADLAATLRWWTLFLGVLQVSIGCVVAFIPASAVPWYRGLLMAHLAYTANGVLMIVLGLLVREMRLGAGALRAWFAALQVGTWTNGTAGLVAAFAGASSKYLPSLNEKFPAPNGADHPVVGGLLVVCGLAMAVGLVLTLVGLARARVRSA
jgi:hypothetical protein